MTTYTKEELNKILELHKKWVYDHMDGIRANLSYANLSRANLSNADLSDADLSYANLSHANLSHANLSHANLSRANLTNAYLTNANLTNANLTYANLTYANLSRANLTDAYLTNAYLTNANLTNANLTNVTDVISFTLIKNFGFAWKKGKDIIVKIGCEEHAIDEWLMDYEVIGLRNRYSPEDIKKYIGMIKLIKEAF